MAKFLLYVIMVPCSQKEFLTDFDPQEFQNLFGSETLFSQEGFDFRWS